MGWLHLKEVYYPWPLLATLVYMYHQEYILYSSLYYMYMYMYMYLFGAGFYLSKINKALISILALTSVILL